MKKNDKYMYGIIITIVGILLISGFLPFALQNVYELTTIHRDLTLGHAARSVDFVDIEQEVIDWDHSRADKEAIMSHFEDMEFEFVSVESISGDTYRIKILNGEARYPMSFDVDMSDTSRTGSRLISIPSYPYDRNKRAFFYVKNMIFLGGEPIKVVGDLKIYDAWIIEDGGITEDTCSVNSDCELGYYCDDGICKQLICGPDEYPVPALYLCRCGLTVSICKERGYDAVDLGECECIYIEEPELECEVDLDCPIGYLCIAGECVEEAEFEPECTVDEDCGEGYVCVGEVCVLEEVPTTECTIDEDCPTGYVCMEGTCIYGYVPSPEPEEDFAQMIKDNFVWIAIILVIIIIFVVARKKKMFRGR